MSLLKVRITRILDTARELSAGSMGAAGVDIAYCGEKDMWIGSGEIKLVSTGWAFEIPEGYAMFVLPRSGTAAKKRLRPVNSPGLIDCDYRGEVFVALENFGLRSGDAKCVEPGEYIAQLVILPVMTPEFERVNRLTETVRGSDGFGSTELKGRNKRGV